jgi:hypothetical protein
MNVLNLKESQNSLLSRLKYLRSHSPNSFIVDRCNTLMSYIETDLDSLETYNKFDLEVDQLNIELGDILKNYDPFMDDDIENVEDSDDSSFEAEWWELESPTEKTTIIRFSLPEETKSVTMLKMESMCGITKRLDLYDRIRKKRILKEVSIELKEKLLDFMEYCNKFTTEGCSLQRARLTIKGCVVTQQLMNVEKWFYMKKYFQKRDLIELYDDFSCNRINQQLNECYTDSEDVQLDVDIDNIDSLYYISEINKKVDDLQHSTILKFAIMYRVENPYFHVVDEIRDLYDMIITSEINFYRMNLLKLLIDPDIEEVLDI